MLQNVRVVQRNLVYVVGLALELCYEDLLKTDRYFGQFGKIIKVRMLCHTRDMSASCYIILCNVMVEVVW